MSACKKINANIPNTQESPPRPEIPFFDHRSYPPIQITLENTPSTLTNRFILKFYAFFEREKYFVKKFSFHVAKEINESEKIQVAYYYYPKKLKPNTKIPLILVFPILDGDHLVCEWQSKILANAGFAVIRVEKKKGFLRKDAEPELHREILQQTIIDMRRILDWAVTLPEIDANHIGVTGVSLGSITASLLMAADTRIKSGSFILWGGNLSKIVLTANEVNIKPYRKRLLQQHSLEELKTLLQPIYAPVDPLTYADRLPTNHIQIFSANRDKVILPEITKELWLKSGKPYWVKFPFVGHFAAAIYFFYGNHQVIKFFRKQFAIKKQ